jgi:hypothetical protein
MGIAAVMNVVIGFAYLYVFIDVLLVIVASEIDYDDEE